MARSSQLLGVLLLLCTAVAGASTANRRVLTTRKHGHHHHQHHHALRRLAQEQDRVAGLTLPGGLGGGTPTPLTLAPVVISAVPTVIAALPTASPTVTGLVPTVSPTPGGVQSWLVQPAKRNCGTVPLGAVERAIQALELAPFLAALLDAAGLGSLSGRRLRDVSSSSSSSSPSAVINVYFTINRIGDLGDASNGDVPESALDQQIQVMNNLMSNTPFTFVNAGVNRVSNTSWWNVEAPGTLMDDMKAATRVGNYADLNIWTTAMQDEILGLTSLPYNTGGSGDPDDGMVLTPFTLPGQAYSEYNLGISGVHELGHWLGLDHPFYGGCSEPNDVVTDTAEMSQPQYDCTAVNSCPNRPSSQGNTDPIHNIMGYTPDACMTDPMTQLQVIRMEAMWNAYRSPFSQSGQVGTGTVKTGPLPPSQQTTGIEPTPAPGPTAPTAATAPTSQPTPASGGSNTPSNAPTTPAPTSSSGGVGGGSGGAAPTPTSSSGPTPQPSPTSSSGGSGSAPTPSGGSIGTPTVPASGGTPVVVNSGSGPSKGAAPTPGASTPTGGSPSSGAPSGSSSGTKSGSSGTAAAAHSSTTAKPKPHASAKAPTPHKPAPKPHPRPHPKPSRKPKKKAKKAKPAKRKPVKRPKRG